MIFYLSFTLLVSSLAVAAPALTSPAKQGTTSTAATTSASPTTSTAAKTSAATASASASATETTSMPPSASTASAELQKVDQQKVDNEFLSLRDPFKIPFTGSDRVVLPTPLETYRLEELHITGIISGPDKPRAILLAPNGQNYIVSENMKLGLEGGVVIKISSNSLKVRQKITNEIGETETAVKELSLPSESQTRLSGNGEDLGAGEDQRSGQGSGNGEYGGGSQGNGNQGRGMQGMPTGGNGNFQGGRNQAPQKGDGQQAGRY